MAKVDRKVSSVFIRLQKRISIDPLSVTDDEIMDAVQSLPENMHLTALLGLQHLRRRATRRKNIKLVKS